MELEEVWSIIPPLPERTHNRNNLETDQENRTNLSWLTSENSFAETKDCSSKRRTVYGPICSETFEASGNEKAEWSEQYIKG